MSTRVKVVKHGGRSYAIVPLSTYRRLQREAGAASDLIAYDRAKAADTGLRVPAAVVDAMLDEVRSRGQSPVSAVPKKAAS